MNLIFGGIMFHSVSVHKWKRNSCHESTGVVVAFSSLVRIRGECLTIYSLPALLKKIFFYVVVVEMDFSSCTLIPLFMLGSVHNGSTSWDDCGWMFPNKLHVSSFLDRFPHCAYMESIGQKMVLWCYQKQLVFLVLFWLTFPGLKKYVSISE